MNKKRIAIAGLWFYAAWTAWSFAAFAFGVNEAFGPIIGLVAAGVVAGDPRRMIWRPTVVTTPQTTPRQGLLQQG
jgi:hypothetical protein